MTFGTFYLIRINNYFKYNRYFFVLNLTLFSNIHYSIEYIHRKDVIIIHILGGNHNDKYGESKRISKGSFRGERM